MKQIFKLEGEMKALKVQKVFDEKAEVQDFKAKIEAKLTAFE